GNIIYLREKVPNIEISTDLIVGFPTETDEDFQETLKVVEQIKFSQIYPFKYSSRPGTHAEKLGDNIPRKTKEERLARLIELQEKINQSAMEQLIHTEQEVLIEEKHPKNENFWNGRTNSYRSITVSGVNLNIGDLISARVTGFRGHWLEAEYMKTIKKSPLTH
ncbi:MAG: TRAM domain-containing protein, partial [Candidatus Hydrogenedens sp.]